MSHAVCVQRHFGGPQFFGGGGGGGGQFRREIDEETLKFLQ